MAPLCVGGGNDDAKIKAVKSKVYIYILSNYSSYFLFVVVFMVIITLIDLSKSASRLVWGGDFVLSSSMVSRCKMF